VKRTYLWLFGLVFSLAVVALCFATSHSEASQDPGLVCSPISSCIPSPVSLAIANGGPTEFGWLPDGPVCGTKTCYVFLKCGCGSRRGLTLCEETSGGPDVQLFPPDCV
jgi:hypothetical protein